MRISAAIQHHPSRAALVPPLAAALAPLAVEVVHDLEPETPSPATWPTYRRALAGTPPWATHRLVVQDDALPCALFASTVALAVAARPGRVIVLCVCGQPHEAAHDVLTARDRGEPFVDLERTRWLPTIAVVWPVEVIPRVLEFAASAGWPADFLADDEVLGRALLGLGLVAVATVPSLVDHPDVVPSVIGRHPAAAGGRPERVAAYFLEDPSGVDWTDPPPREPFRRLT